MEWYYSVFTLARRRSLVRCCVKGLIVFAMERDGFRDWTKIIPLSDGRFEVVF
jgi:hypothetical protein